MPTVEIQKTERGEDCLQRRGYMDMDEKVRAMNALHAYESLEALEDDGDEDAAALRERLFAEWIDAWEELKPMLAH